MAEGKKRHAKPRRVAEGVDRMPSGRLRIRWYEGRDNGKERVRMRTLPDGTSISEAKKARQVELDRVQRHRRNGGGGDGTVGSFAERWLRDYPRPAETTNMHNESRIRPFVRDFGQRKPESITRAEARLWASGGVAPPHLVKVVRKWDGVTENDEGELVVPPHRNNVPAVRAMFTNLVEDEQFDLDKNVFGGLQLKQERGRADITVLELDELERLEAIARRMKGPVFAAMIRFAAWTGLRPAELYALRWKDVNLDTRRVMVRRQYRSKIKNPSERTTPYLKTDQANRNVPLLDPAYEALESLGHPLNADDLIFTALRGEQMTARSHSYLWVPVREVFWETLDDDRKCPYCAKGREHDQHERGTLPMDFDFYELRHFFGSYLANTLKVTPMDVAEKMGHKDGGRLAMARYFHKAREEESDNRIFRAYDRHQADRAADEADRKAQ